MRLRAGTILLAALVTGIMTASMATAQEAKETNVNILQAQINLLQKTNEALREKIKELEAENAQLKAAAAKAAAAEVDVVVTDAEAKPKPTAETAPETMPQVDIERVERALTVLERRQQCETCKGEPLTSRQEHVPTGTAGERQTKTFYDSCRPCNATGQTPMRDVQPTINIVRQLMDKYGNLAPSSLQARTNDIIRVYQNPPRRQRWIYVTYSRSWIKGYFE